MSLCRNIKRYGLVLPIIALFCLMAQPAWAGQSVAVMPLADLSHGPNGLNLNLSRVLAKNFEGKGFSVLAEEEIFDFMVRHRIRWVGHIDSYYLSRFRDELAADFVLIGTVSQRREKMPPALGVVLQLIRTEDGRTIWAGGSELCKTDVNKILGLSEPQHIEDIEKMVVAQIVDDVPVNPGQGFAERQFMLIFDKVEVTPKVVRPGGTIRFRARLSKALTEMQDIRITIHVRGRELPAQFNAAEESFELSWQAEQFDGRYPVYLTFSGNGVEEKIMLGGSYRVDGMAPRLTLKMQTRVYNKTAVFNGKLDFVPRLLEPDPLLRWQVLIKDKDGLVLQEGKGEGSLPASLTWQGQNLAGYPVADGNYIVELMACDEAMNCGTAMHNIRLARKPPEVQMAFERYDQRVEVNLDINNDVPLAFWRFEARDFKGKLLVEKTGQRLPAKLMVALPTDERQSIRCLIETKDVLGNKKRERIEDLVRLAEGKPDGDKGVKEEVLLSEAWVEDF